MTGDKLVTYVQTLIGLMLENGVVGETCCYMSRELSQLEKDSLNKFLQPLINSFMNLLGIFLLHLRFQKHTFVSSYFNQYN